MVSVGEAAGKKRKAAAAVHVAPAKREPRRGLGVAELERIRVGLEMAESCYVVSSLSKPAAAVAAPAPALHPALLVHGAGVVALRHPYVGNGPVQLQIQRQYLAPYYLTQHFANDSLTRFVTSNGHPSSHHNTQVDQIQSAVTALPIAGQAASSESSSSAYQLPDRRRAQPRQPGRTARPQVAFVDLVDDNGGAIEELDLELKL